MLTVTFLIKTIIDPYVIILLLRAWMQWLNIDFYNPCSQFIARMTEPVIAPLRRKLPSIGPIDTASLLLALLLVNIKYQLLLLIRDGRIGLNACNLLLGLISLLKAFGYLVLWAVLIRSIMSWMSRNKSPIDYVIHQLTEPLMAPIRRMIPSRGGMDFSGMVIILILYFLNYLGMDLFSTFWFFL